jgi:predicted nucleotidyltransferase
MNTLDELRAPAGVASVLFECVAGSRAYGTNTATSDEDVRGIFAVAAGAYLNLVRPADQIADERGNVVYYSLRRVIELLTQANPNVLELLFMPEDCIVKSSPEMAALIEQRGLFISKKCLQTHSGYAVAQIRKARGQNKWVNNPKARPAPVKEEYCYIIPWRGDSDGGGPPSRPVPLAHVGWALDEYHAARVEHTRDVYRLYHYGKDAKGVFRGSMLVCESIPKSDEPTHFAGFLIYNEQAWKQALVEHQNYWAWRRDRNDARWQQQERGELDFDAKNMMHTVRLLLSGRSIMQSGAPIVRFAGDDLALLMSIRQGQRPFEEIMQIAEGLLADCERLAAGADLPQECDAQAAAAVLQELTAGWERRCS